MKSAKILILFVWCLPGFCFANKPNIIVIFTDDHGWPDIGAAGVYADLKTPHIDALAADGVRATQGYVTAPQCVPSRAGLLTGRSQNRFGLESNVEVLTGFDAQVTMADRLKKAGYATGMAGKWHLGPSAEITRHGFDEVYFKNSNGPGWSNVDLEGNDRSPGPIQTGGYHLDVCALAACAFIERHKDEPFFFYGAFRGPHVPLDAPKKYLERFPGEMPERRRQALAMLAAIDDGVGRIRATLKSCQLEQNTLIFLMGDNGAPLKIHKLDAPGGGPGWDGSLNAPMNGEKGMLSEGGIRVPYLVAWPGTIPGKQVYTHPVSSLDVAATAVSIAGLPLDDALDGVNLIPFLSGKEAGTPHELLTWRWIAQSAIREGKWKLLVGGDRQYLYDLESDPGESNNLLSTQPEVAERLHARLTSWSAELQPPGLNGKMAETWGRYFDHYLEGKLQALPKAKAPVEAHVQGWLARNARMNGTKDGLQIRAKVGAKPFIVVSKLQLPSEIIALVRMRTSQGGQAGFSWREEGQKDFSSTKVSEWTCAASDAWQEKQVRLKGTSGIIHVRLLLPRGPTDVATIEFQDAQGAPLKRWNFSK